MKKKLSAVFLLSIFAFSFILMAPLTSTAFEENFPDLGTNKRIEFLDYIIKIMSDNRTRSNLTSNLLFANRVAYYGLISSQKVQFTGVRENFFGIIYTGVDDGNGHRIYLRTNVTALNANLNFTQQSYTNIILWDNDKSLITFLEDLNTSIQTKNIPNLLNLLYRISHKCETIFTGDEIIIIVPVFLWTLNYNVPYQMDNYYIIDVNDNGPYDDNGTNIVTFTQLGAPIQTQIIQKAKNNPALLYLMNSTSGTKRGSYSQFFYLIQQIWFKKLYFNKQGTSFTYDIDLVSVRHLLFRAALYNDSNQNGLMDICFNQTAKGMYYPYSNEAVCILELVNATKINFGQPIIDETPMNEMIKWNATLENPFVRLNPYGQSSETGMLINAPVVPMGNTSFGFTFKPRAFMPLGGTTGYLSGVLKVDNMIGGLNESGLGLKGIYKNLDLAVIYLSDIFELTSQTKISGSAPQTNATARNDGEQPVSALVKKTTSATKSLDFFIGTDCITTIDLAGLKYSIGNEDPMTPTHNATAAVIPYGLYQHAVDQTGELMTQRGNNVDWNLSAKVTHSTYLYEVCYPDYNGQVVYQDPTYTILGSWTIPGGGGIPGFEFYGILLSFSIVGCIVLFLKKRKASANI